MEGGAPPGAAGDKARKELAIRGKLRRWRQLAATPIIFPVATDWFRRETVMKVSLILISGALLSAVVGAPTGYSLQSQASGFDTDTAGSFLTVASGSLDRAEDCAAAYVCDGYEPWMAIRWDE